METAPTTGAVALPDEIIAAVRRGELKKMVKWLRKEGNADAQDADGDVAEREHRRAALAACAHEAVKLVGGARGFELRQRGGNVGEHRLKSVRRGELPPRTPAIWSRRPWSG